MNNQKYGTKFESELKRKLLDSGLTVLSLALPETADLIVISDKVRILECKTVKGDKFSIKNKQQYEKLQELAKKFSVYIVVKYHQKRGHKALIKFYYLNHHFSLKKEDGYSLEDFVNHCKNE
ncbi:MAG: hypothetical protein QXV17_07305 [Candidatus Micrarchaeaceae archaeon]